MFKAQHCNEQRDAFAHLLRCLLYLSPWWNVFKSPPNTSHITSLAFADYIGYNANQFVILLEIAGLASIYEGDVYVTFEKEWNEFLANIILTMN